MSQETFNYIHAKFPAVEYLIESFYLFFATKIYKIIQKQQIA